MPLQERRSVSPDNNPAIGTLLQPMFYFTYGGFLDPARLESVAPGIKVALVAHLPETRLTFPTADGLPSVEPATGHTVWGGIFEVTGKQMASITLAEAIEGREPREDLRAVDRAGKKYEVVTFVHPAKGSRHPPSAEYMSVVVAGARHWGLPTGWVVGLQELAEDAHA
jgi:AIG2-like family